ncbi:hypothetical protein HK101_006390 [Irineochytrium annulatum]|nr:hypothetical protein HK101_006390 [Irineochytrium annulatum]
MVVSHLLTPTSSSSPAVASPVDQLRRLNLSASPCTSRVSCKVSSPAAIGRRNLTRNAVSSLLAEGHGNTRASSPAPSPATRPQTQPQRKRATVQCVYTAPVTIKASKVVDSSNQIANLALRLFLSVLAAAERRGIWPSSPCLNAPTAAASSAPAASSPSFSPSHHATNLSSQRSPDTPASSPGSVMSADSMASPQPNLPTPPSSSTTSAFPGLNPHLTSHPLCTPQLVRLIQQLTRVNGIASSILPPSTATSNSPLERTPHLILHALYLAHRMLSQCPDNASLPDHIAGDAVALLMGCIMMSESQLSDRQTGTRVWVRVLAKADVCGDDEEGMRRWLAGVKRQALVALAWGCHVQVEDYVMWLRDLRVCMGALAF